MDKQILVLTGNNLDIRVNSSGLKIHDGFPTSGDVRETYINRGLNELEHIVISGYTGAITFEAIKWIVDCEIMVTFLDSLGNIITSFIPNNHISGIIKRRQATAGNDLNMKISTWILSEKFQEQRKTLNYIFNAYGGISWWTAGREKVINQAITISEDRQKALSLLSNIDSQRTLEAQVAAAYWKAYDGIPIRWEKTPKKISTAWQHIGGRTSPKTGSPRKAVDPFNACLNYLYAVLETKVRQACIMHNIDVDFGIIHVDKSNRNSLVFDLMEGIRPKVDRILFDWFIARVFNSKDFFETREGVCKVSPNVTTKIIPLLTALNTDVVKIVKEFTKFFKDTSVKLLPEEFKKLTKIRKEKQKLKENVVITQTPKDDKLTVSQGKAYAHCLECNNIFIPERPAQKFCCSRHKETYKKRLVRGKKES